MPTEVPGFMEPVVPVLTPVPRLFCTIAKLTRRPSAAAT
jgi:hypothetical protein